MHIQRQSETFAYRIAAVNQDSIAKLHGEFRDWWRSGAGPIAFRRHPLVNNYHKLTDSINTFNETNVLPPGGEDLFNQHRRAQDIHKRIQNEMKRRGPIGWWPNVENFLKAKYPAAHKGFEAGQEQAAHDLDSSRPSYETGADALSQHGYDPREVAAGMVFLHNESHPFRGDMAEKDQKRLTDIFQKRQQMQQSYEKKQLVNAMRRFAKYSEAVYCYAQN
jgi:hypothetical protein